MKSIVLCFLCSALCLISYGVSFAAFYRFEFYTMAFFLDAVADLRGFDAD